MALSLNEPLELELELEVCRPKTLSFTLPTTLPIVPFVFPDPESPLGLEPELPGIFFFICPAILSAILSIALSLNDPLELELEVEVSRPKTLSLTFPAILLIVPFVFPDFPPLISLMETKRTKKTKIRSRIFIVVCCDLFGTE